MPPLFAHFQLRYFTGRRTGFSFEYNFCLPPCILRSYETHVISTPMKLEAPYFTQKIAQTKFHMILIK